MKSKAFKRTGSVVLGAMFLVGASSAANAALRVRATVRTPDVSLHLAGGGYAGYRGGIVFHEYYDCDVFEITRRDRKIARRLARYAGVPTRRVLRLRRQGYRWFEIGNWFGMSRRVVRAAMHRHTWVRFIRGGRNSGENWGYGNRRYDTDDDRDFRDDHNKRRRKFKKKYRREHRNDRDDRYGDRRARSRDGDRDDDDHDDD